MKIGCFALIEPFTPMRRQFHCKDMPAEMESQRGKVFGCGMSKIPLGDGVVGIEAVVQELKAAGFDGPTTLEIAGADALKTSAERLRKWEANAIY